MKTLKLITTGLLALLIINTASATPPTEIRITGATALEPAVINSIENILNPAFLWGSAGGLGSSALQQIFVGTTKVGNMPVIIKTSWSDSGHGIYSLAAGVPTPFPFIIDTAPLTTGDANIPAADITESHTADVALSDIFVTTSPFAGAGFAQLTDTMVGVVPYEFVKGAYTPSSSPVTPVPGGYPGVTNIAQPQAQELLGGGLALNQFTGNSSDQAIFAECIGRDHTSGIRIGVLCDIQYVPNGSPLSNYFAAVLQYIANGQTVGATELANQSASTGVISSVFPWPVETVLGETRAAGNEGFFFTGGNVAATLNRPCDTSQGNYIISYLAMCDAESVNPGPGVSGTDGAGNPPYTYTPSQNALTCDGYYPGTPANPFAPPFNSIINGGYSLWGYEHFLYLSTLAGNQLIIANQISTQLTKEADFGGCGILLGVMNAAGTYRLTDGGTIYW